MWSNQQGEVAPPLRRSYAFWLSLLLFLIIMVANLIAVRNRLETSTDGATMRLTRVELSARVLYGDFLPFQQYQTSQRWDEVISQLTVPNASATTLARAVILIYEYRHLFGEPIASQRLDSLIQRISQLAPASPQGAALVRWCRAVYGDEKPIELPQQSNLRRTIDELQLGWFRLLAMKHLAQRVGDAVSAQRWEQRARAEANRLQRAMLILFALIATLLAGGIAAWLAYLLWRSNRPRPTIVEPPLLPAEAHHLLWGMVAYFAMILFGSIVGSFALSGRQPGSSYTLLAMASVQVLTGGTALWALHRLMQRRGIRWSALGWSWKPLLPQLVWGVGAYAATIPLLLLTLALAQLLLPNVPAPAHPIALFASSDSPFWLTFVLLLMAAVFAPLFEEIFFRGVLLSAVWTISGRRWVAVVSSAAVFSVLHPQIYLGWIAVFTIGIMIGALFVERRSLLSCICMHALNNSIALVGVHLLRITG